MRGGGDEREHASVAVVEEFLQLREAFGLDEVHGRGQGRGVVPGRLERVLAERVQHSEAVLFAEDEFSVGLVRDLVDVLEGGGVGAGGEQLSEACVDGGEVRRPELVQGQRLAEALVELSQQSLEAAVEAERHVGEHGVVCLSGRVTFSPKARRGRCARAVPRRLRRPRSAVCSSRRWLLRGPG